MTMRMVAAAVLLAVAGPVAAQDAAAVAAIDPARLAVARQVVDLAYPPASRSAMFAGVQDAIGTVMQRAIEANPELKHAFDADPRVKPIFDRYLVKVRARTMAALEGSLPALFDAYGHAYARRFTLEQLGELKAFFATPTGQIYTSRALSLLTDPDVAAANQALFAGAMNDMRADAKAMADEIKALPPLTAKPTT